MPLNLLTRVAAIAILVCLAGCRNVETAQAPDTLPPYKVAQLETLLETRLPCLGCHTIDGRGGAIGPDLSQVGARLSHAQIDSMVRTPDARMPNTVMPAVIMREDWRTLVVRHLAERGGSASSTIVDLASPLIGTPPTRGDAGGRGADQSLTRGEVADAGGSVVPDGGALYGKYCVSCHGATGGGDGPNAERLPVIPTVHSDAATMSERPDDSLYDAIYGGGYIMNRSHTMPPFGATLSRAQIRALVSHIRTLCDCVGPAWSRDGLAGDGR